MPISDPDVREAREALVRRHMADENALDFEAVLAAMPNPRYEIMATGAVHAGRDEVSAYYKESRTAFPDQRNEILSLRHADDAVIVEFWLRGTHRGPFKSIPATNQPFACQMIAVFEFEGDALITERVYFDSLTILKQLLAGMSLRRPSTLVLAARALLGLRKGLR